MIEVRNLYKRFGVFEALKYVSFDVAPRETVGLLGENGAGKTTMMRIISCFLPPTSGTVRVGGHDVVFQSHQVRCKIGYMPESVPLYPMMRVEEYLTYRARLKGVRGKAVKPSVERAMSLVHVTGRRRSLITTLSKGLRQRVGLADALVHSPELLILDEPTSGLDPTQRLEVRKLVKELGDEHTVLISTHILPEVEASCERVVVVNQGNIVATESVEGLRRLGSADRFTVRASGSAERARAAVTGLDGVAIDGDPDVDGTSLVLRYRSENGAPGRALVVRALVESGVDVWEVTADDLTLESAFVRLVQHEDGAPDDDTDPGVEGVA